MYYLGQTSAVPPGEWIVTPAQKRFACMNAGNRWIELPDGGVCIPLVSSTPKPTDDAPTGFKCEYGGINWCIVGGAILALFLVSGLTGRR